MSLCNTDSNLTVPRRPRLVLDATQMSPSLTNVEYSRLAETGSSSRRSTDLYHEVCNRITQGYTIIMSDEELLVSPITLTPDRDCNSDPSVPCSISPLFLDEHGREKFTFLSPPPKRRWLIDESPAASICNVAPPSPEQWSDVDLSTNELYHLTLPNGNRRSNREAMISDLLPAAIPATQLERIEGFSQQHFPTSTVSDPEPVAPDQTLPIRQSRPHRLRTQLRRLSKILTPPSTADRRKSSVSSLLERFKRPLVSNVAPQAEPHQQARQLNSVLRPTGRGGRPRAWSSDSISALPILGALQPSARLHSVHDVQAPQADAYQVHEQNAYTVRQYSAATTINTNLQQPSPVISNFNSEASAPDDPHTTMRRHSGAQYTTKPLEQRCQEYRGRRFSSPWWWRTHLSRENRRQSKGQRLVRKRERIEERTGLLAAEGYTGMWDLGGDAWRTAGVYM